MSRDEWLAAFAAAAGVPPPSLQEIRDLLALAATAAHASERPAAPLACWVAARSGMSLAELIAAAEGIGGEAPRPAPSSSDGP